jgi:hypothetical protein
MVSSVAGLAAWVVWVGIRLAAGQDGWRLQELADAATNRLMARRVAGVITRYPASRRGGNQKVAGFTGDLF